MKFFYMIVVVYIMIFIWMGFYSKIFNDSLEKNIVQICLLLITEWHIICMINQKKFFLYFLKIFFYG